MSTRQEEWKRASDDDAPAALGWMGWKPDLQLASGWTGGLGSLFANLSTEYTGFVQARMKEDLGLPMRLASCKTPIEVVQVYQAFFTKALGDYQSEYAEFARIGSAFAGSPSRAPNILGKQRELN
jgi:hypothetical protein